MKPARLPHIDALRGISALGVLTVHSGVDGLPLWASRTVIFGARGVQLFFVLSGFSILLSLEESLRAHKHVDWRAFFLRRIMRIGPLFWLLMPFYFFLRGTAFEPLEWLMTATFSHGLSPIWFNSLVPGGWSIGTEFLFYLSVPFVAKFVLNSRSALIFVVIACAVAHIGVQFPLFYFSLPAKGTLEGYLYSSYIGQIPVFAIGVFSYHAFRASEPQALRQWVTLAVALLMGFALNLVRPYILVSYVFGILVFVMKEWQPRLVVNSALQWIGKLSFGLYLTHFIALELRSIVLDLPKVSATWKLIPPLGQEALSFSMVLGVSLILSYGAYRWVEQPGIALGRRLTNPQPNRSPRDPFRD